MINEPFVNRYGEKQPAYTDKTENRTNVYIVIKSGADLVCQYNEVTGLYSFPKDGDVVLNENPTLEFTVFENINDNNGFVREQQIYKVFEVENADIKDTPLVKCAINDLLVGNVALDATQKKGFKNLVVRVR